MSPKFLVPDSITPYIGYKALRLNQGGYLSSPSYAMQWPPKERAEALCAQSLSNWCWMPIQGEPRSLDDTIEHSSGVVFMTASSSASIVRPASLGRSPKPNNPLPDGWNWSWEPQTHDPAAEGCSCGIYVVSMPEACANYLDDQSVVAKIAVWGNTVRGTHGARGQYAYPQMLYAPDEENLPVLSPASLLYGIPYMVAPFVEQDPEPLISPSLWVPYKSRKRQPRWRMVK